MGSTLEEEHVGLALNRFSDDNIIFYYDQFLTADIGTEWQLLEMTETKLALEQGAHALSSAQVSFWIFHFLTVLLYVVS